MTTSAPDLFARYQPWRPYVEPGFWISYYCAQAIMNSWVLMHDLKGVYMKTQILTNWQLAVVIVCSNIVMLFMVPAVIAVDRRFPLHWGALRRNLAFHFLASIVYCIIHVPLSVALVKLVFLSQGDQYVIGDWWSRMLFQYVNDIRFYFTVVVILNLYRLLLLRWQGEASLLAAPDEGPPVEPLERPERFLVRKFGKDFLLPAADIEWIQAWGNYVNLHVRGHDHPLRSTMAAIEARLNPERFIRVHRSYIVNLDFLSQIEPLDSGDARANMSSGQQIPVSRRYLDQLRKASVASPAVSSPAVARPCESAV